MLILSVWLPQANCNAQPLSNLQASSPIRLFIILFIFDRIPFVCCALCKQIHVLWGGNQNAEHWESNEKQKKVDSEVDSSMVDLDFGVKESTFFCLPFDSASGLLWSSDVELNHLKRKIDSLTPKSNFLANQLIQTR